MAKDTYGERRLKRAVIHFVGGRVAQALARAGLILVLVRVLPVADYGAYMLIVGLSELMLQVVSFGITPIAQRFMPELIQTLNLRRLLHFVATLVLLQILVLSLTTAGLGLGWRSITPLLGFSPEQTEATRYAVILFLLVPAFRFSGELLEALLEQGRAQTARALMPLGRMIGILILIGVGRTPDLSVLVIVDIVVTLICLILGYKLLYSSLIAQHATGSESGQIPLRQMAEFGWHMAAADLLGSTKQPGAIRMALANTLGVVDSGLFAFLQSLERLISRYLPGTLLRGIVRPMLLTRAFEPGGMSIVEAGTGLLLKTNMLIIAAGCVVIAVGGDELVDLISGGKFKDAGFTLLLMFLVMGITAQRTVIEMVMQVTGHTKTLRTTAIIAPIALAAVWAFSKYGLNVAIIIIAVGAALSNGIAMSVLARSSTGFHFDWRGFFAMTVPAAVAIFLGWWLARSMHQVPAAALALMFFGIALLVTRPFTLRESRIVERATGPWASRLFKPFAKSTPDRAN